MNDDSIKVPDPSVSKNFTRKGVMDCTFGIIPPEKLSRKSKRISLFSVKNKLELVEFEKSNEKKTDENCSGEISPRFIEELSL